MFLHKSFEIINSFDAIKKKNSSDAGYQIFQLCVFNTMPADF